MAKKKTLKGLANVFDEAAEQIVDEVKQALNVCAEDLLNDAIDLAPLEEGHLRESGSVDHADETGDKIEANVGFNTDRKSVV